MKIGFQVEHFDPSRGGAETYVCALIRRLIADSHEVHVFTEFAEEAPLGLKVHLIRPYTTQAVAMALGDAYLDVVVGSRKCAGMNVYQPHDGTFHGVRRQKLAMCRNPVLRNLKEAWLALVPKRREAANNERNIYAAGNPSPQIVAISRMVYRDIQTFYQVPSDRIHLVYNGVDVRRFSPERCRSLRAEARRRLRIPEKATCFLIVAQNFRRKGLRELIEATSHLKRRFDDFCVLVAGKENPWPYQTMAARLGCRNAIHFAGAFRDVEHAYAAADVFVLPTWYDPCSLVVLEAWGCGLPVITTRFNGASELMNPGREGFIIDSPAHTRELGQAMVSLLDPERRRAMGARARALAEQHTLEHNYRDMMAVFEIAASQNKKIAA